jgi:HlyD family secretion protein
MTISRTTVAALALAAAALVGCSEGGKRRAGATDNVPRVEVVRPNVVESLPRRIELTATVEPMQRADVCARVPGVVKHLPDDLDIGRTVAAGDRLIELDVPDLRAQKAYKEAQLDLAEGQKALVAEARKVLGRELEESRRLEKRFEAEYNARADELERVVRLVERNSQAPEVAQEKMRLKEAGMASWRASQAQTETKKAKLDACDVDERVAESRVKVARAELRGLEEQIGLATMTAPFAGVVTKRWVDRGATIKDAGVPLLTLMRVDRVRVVIDVPDRDAPLVSSTEQNPNPDGKGDPVTIRFPAIAEKGDAGVFQGFVTRKAEARDPATRTMRTEVHLDNGGGLIQPGMYGTASILLEERKNVLTVPPSALVRRGDTFEVLYLTDDKASPPRGSIKLAQVRIGLDVGDQVQVTSGLTADMLVVLKRNSAVQIGDEVIGMFSRRP